MRKTITILLFFVFSNLLAQNTATLQKTLDLQTINGVEIPFQNGMPLPSFEKQNRTILDLRGEWKKLRFTSTPDLTLSERTEATIQTIQNNEPLWQVDYDDSALEPKSIPAVENTMHTFPTVPERYDDGIWYRYKFDVADSLSSKFAKLSFLAVNYVADVWINGQYVGYHEGGYTPFAFDISDKLNYGAENLISVRVDNIEWDTRDDIVPAYDSDWFNYAGIIHDVYIEFANKTSIVRNDIRPLDKNGNISVKTVVYNNDLTSKILEIRHSIYKANIDSTNIQTEFTYELIGEMASFSGETSSNISLSSGEVFPNQTNLSVNNPDLWTMKNPNLYILKTELLENSVVIDEFSTQFGIRTVETNSDKLLINGNVSFLTGAARHEDHPEYGRSVPKEIIYSDFKLIKESNILYIRTAHYPNHPYTYLITDRLGIAVMEEIPVWWFNTETPWLIQNNERHIHQQMFREMVYKDFNRPSILFWSTANECKDTPNRLIFHETIMNDIHTNYPDGRLVTQSAAADYPGYADETQTPLDAAGWTMYFGIFHGGTYYNGTLLFLVNARNAFPNKPIIDTEFGYWSSENGSSQRTQVTVFEQTFDAFRFFAPINENGVYNPNGHLIATTWWCVFDWYTYHQTTGYQSMGLISMDRTWKKPVYYTLYDNYQPWANMGGMIVGIDENNLSGNAEEFVLFQNFPNPVIAKNNDSTAKHSTTIKFSVPTSNNSSNVNIKIYNTIGEEVAEVVNKPFSAGIHEIVFDTSNLANGVYIYKIQSGNFIQAKKMIIVK